MTENNNENIKSSSLKEDMNLYDKLVKMRTQHAEEKTEWERNTKKIINDNAEFADQVQKLRDEMNKLNDTNKFLEKELWAQKKQASNKREEESLSEGKKMSKEALNIIKNRIREKYNASCSCNDCKK